VSILRGWAAITGVETVQSQHHEIARSLS